MPEIKKNFVNGVMDMGTDARLLPDGSYRYGLNVDVLGSESSDQGVIQNIRGNVARDFDFTIPADNPYVIGALADDANNRIFYFWVGASSEGIYEYDLADFNEATSTGKLNRILEFSKKDGDAKSVLNFSPEHLITGAVIVDNLLIFTDGVNPIRKVNIDRFRGSGNFTGCHYDETDEEFQCPDGAITRVNPATEGDMQYLKSEKDPTYDGEGNSFLDLELDDETEDAIIPLITTNTFIGDLINLAKRPPIFPPSISKLADGISDDDYGKDKTEYEAKGAKPEDKLFDTVARFAIRYRYKDGETSALSPFSAPAFLPRKYKINNETGVLESMVNYMSNVDITFDVGPKEVTEVDIVYKESDSSAVYLVDTIIKGETKVDESTDEIVKDGVALKNSTIARRSYLKYNYDGSKVYRVLPSSELNRIYDNVPIKAKALDVAGNRLVLGNFEENYSFTRNNEDGVEIIPNFDVEVRSYPKRKDDVNPFRTLKTGRDYQIGLVYLDKEGRQSPVVVSNNNTVHVGYDKAGQRNKLLMTVKHEAPYWAAYYRPFIKQSKGVFYNVIPSYARYLYRVDPDSNTSAVTNKYYLRLHDADRNKVDVGDILVRKIDNDEILDRFEYWRVVELKRFVGRDVETFEDNKLPMGIPNEHEGYYALLAPTEDGYDIVKDGEDNNNPYPASETDPATQTSVWETIPADNVGDFYWEGFETFRVYNGKHTASKVEVIRATDDRQVLNSDTDSDDFGAAVEGSEGEIQIELDWYNSFGYGRGVEAMVVEDRFNGKALDQGVRASTIQEDFQQYVKESWLIHSGVYVDSTKLNRLNEFNPSLPLQRELDVNDGSIQKLHFRDTDMIVFQERKVKRIPINKNVIVTADGNNLATTGSSFFGTSVPYAGEYGIAKNPESFATYGNRIYFADKNSGAIMRLSNNGLTEISKQGLEAFVRRYIADAEYIKLSYNNYSDELDISLQNIPQFTQYRNNRTQRAISTQFRYDPEDACNANLNGLDFETYYTVMENPGTGDMDTGDFVPGDRIYLDADYTSTFDGDNHYYRVRKGRGASATYDEVIQINDDGVVMRVVDSCREEYPLVINHTAFNISSESFQTEIDACANGVLDQVAYVGVGRDQEDLSSEPDLGNYIYDTRHTLVRTNRAGWFKINIAQIDEDDATKIVYRHFVILIRNGVVVQSIDCERIEKGRSRFTGSEVLPVQSNETSFDQNIRICTADRDHGWWIDDDRDLPLVGDTIYANNFDDESVDQAGYIHVGDAQYIEFGSDGVVDSIGSCGEYLCTIEPYKYLEPNTDVPMNDTSITFDSSNSFSEVFTIDSSIDDRKLNDYYELDSDNEIVYRVGGVAGAAVCTKGTDNCLKVILNDHTDDAKAFDNGDAVTVRLVASQSGEDDIYIQPLPARISIDSSDNYTIEIDKLNDIFERDSDKTYTITKIDNKYKFKFLGFEVEDEDENVGIPGLDVKWFEVGVERYPKAGLYTTELRPREDDYVLFPDENYKLTPEDTATEIEVNPTIAEICYDEVTGGDDDLVFALTTQRTRANVVGSGTCSNTTNDTLYFNVKDPTLKYYTENALTNEYDGNDLYTGIAYDNGSDNEDNASVTHWEFVNDDGVVDKSKTIWCSAKYEETLGFVPLINDFADPGQEACRLYDTSDTSKYWADQSDWTPGDDNSNDDVTRIYQQDGSLSTAVDGWYADATLARKYEGGKFVDSQTCKEAIASRTWKVDAASAQGACTGTDTTVYSASSDLAGQDVAIYADNYGSEYIDSQFISDGTTTGYWNKTTGQLERKGSCTVSENIGYVENRVDIGEENNCTRNTSVIYSGGNAATACANAQANTSKSTVYLNASPANTTSSTIYSSCTSDTYVPSGTYYSASSKKVGEWDSSDQTWSNVEDCVVQPNENKIQISILYGTGDNVCISGTSGTAYIRESDAFSNTTTLFKNADKEDDVKFDACTNCSIVKDSWIRTWNGTTLSGGTSCPSTCDSNLTIVGANLGRSTSISDVCGKTKSSYDLNGAFAGASNIWVSGSCNSEACNVCNKATSGYYTDGGIIRYWDQNSLADKGPCYSINIEDGDSNDVGQQWVALSNDKSTENTLQGKVTVDAKGGEAWVQLNATLNINYGCYSVSGYSSVPASTATFEFNGVEQTLTAKCGQQGSATISGYFADGDYDFTMDVGHESWAAKDIGKTVRFQLV